MERIAKEIRALTVECIASKGSGHIGGSLSIVDVLTVLYYKIMNIDPKNPLMESRDRLVVSKGHAGPAVYATLCHKGYITKDTLLTLNKFGTLLPSHCDMNKTPGIDMTTGSLGQGISAAVGMAIGSKLKNDNANIYCIIGDGESEEGQVYEALSYAVQQKLSNLTVFLDHNKLQLDDYCDNINSLGDIYNKYKAMGLDVISVDGHNLSEIEEAIKAKHDKPKFIILETIKGKGVSFAEEAGVGCHSMPITEDMKNQALKELLED